MSTIVTRAGKGSALTYVEVDANFTNLNTDKIQSGNTVAALTITSATINGGTITGITDLAVADGGTGLSTLTAGYIPFGAGTSAFGSSANLFWDSANNRLGIGTSAPTTKLTINNNTALPSAGAITGTNLWQVGADSTVNAILLDSFGSVLNIIGRRSQGTAASPSSVTSGINLLQVQGYGYGATAYSSAARVSMSMQASEAWTDTAQGTQILFSTTTNGAAASAERMRIDNAGNVGIGTTSPTQLLDINGNLAITGTARRITGDFGNATQTNRVLFQSSTTNGPTSVGVIPNGTSLTTNVALYSSSSDPTNASFTRLGMNGTSDARLESGITGTGTYLPLTMYTNGSERLRIDTSGNVGIGVTPAGTGLLELKAGTATVAPLEFNSGTNLTTPVAGAVEYDGTIITATSNTNFRRGTIPLTNYTSGTGTTLGTNTEATLQALLPAANDTITLSIGTYFIDTSFIITRGASTTSATARLNILGAGTAAGNFSGMSLSAPTSGGTTGAFSFDAVNINVSNVLTAASTTSAGVYQISLRGILKVTTSGTIIPQYNLSANINGAGTVAKVLYLRLQQLDTQSAAAAGPAGTGWA